MPFDLSPIQSHIISLLKNAKYLRYSALHPDKVPNDLFNYHLQYLVKKGLLLRTDEGYGLSEKGIQHVADPFPQTGAITSLFKVNVITIVSRVVKGKIEILQQIRRSNPSYGKIGCMGGVVLKGEKIEIAATRKLKVETGLEAVFRHVGCERRTIYAHGELFSDVLFPISYADSCTGELIVDSDYGHNIWVPIDQAILNESDPQDSIQAIRTVLEAIRDKKIKKLPYFFTEEVLTR